MKYIKLFKELNKNDTALVGGKNANLGEMYQKLGGLGVRVANGFAITTEGYDYFIKFNNFKDKIKEILKETDIYNVSELQKGGEEIRNLIKQGDFPEDLKEEILQAFNELKEMQTYEDNNVRNSSRESSQEFATNNNVRNSSRESSQEFATENKKNDFRVAVRSSASAEDLPEASFAGQQETYLNVSEKDLLEKVKFCFASLFTDRAIFYRQEKGFDHFQVKLSVGVQKMVRSDLASSGVMFTIDTDTGLNKVIVINGVWGLGELIVQGKVIPDEWIVFKDGLERGFRSIISKRLGEKIKKIVYADVDFSNESRKGGTKEIETTEEEIKRFSLNDDEVLELAKMGYIIEKHYGQAMDIEWAKDGIDGKLYIVQARAETVYSTKKKNVYEEYRLKEKGEVLLKGIAIGSKITSGKVRVIKDVSKINEFQQGEILVTEMTDPDWVPIMKIAKGIITDKGGRTCFSGDTWVLTNKGFMSIKDIVKNYKNTKIKVLSLNPKNYKLEWKEVINGFERKAETIKVSFSQTGKVLDNFLKCTKDHQFLTFENRKLIKKEIWKIIKEGDYVISLSKIPKAKSIKIDPRLGYILGAIFTDGHIYLSRTRGEIRFIQKENKEKRRFISKLRNYWYEIFKKEMKRYKTVKSISFIRGRKIYGEATHFRCHSKLIAQKLKNYYENIDKLVLSASGDFLLEFIAGVIDGDGTFNNKDLRINIYVSKDKLLKALVLTCLRLGIQFQISRNRGIFNFQIVDNFGKVFSFTQRIKGSNKREKFGSILFSAKQLLNDIVDFVNYRGRIKPYVENNLLIDKEKIKKYLIPMIEGSVYNHELTKIVNSDLKMLRVIDDNHSEKSLVYNITVLDNHNYFVFTNKYTPILVANCHAAIVSRELGIPAIVGTQKATEILKTGDEITIDCSTGITGYVYKGLLDYEVIPHDLEKLPETKTKIYVNIGLPDEAWERWYLPVKGVGLAREEFIIAEEIKIHPNALIEYPNLPKEIKKKIDELTAGYNDKKLYFVDKLAEGIAKICTAYYPYEVIVRFSDFKTNEYRNLIGGELYEPNEENPMIGWRGASRYYHPKFRRAFELEVLAMKKVREEFGLDNLTVMIPFCRTPEEGKKVVEILENIMDKRKEKGYKIYVMCEIPSNILQAEEFLEIFDGMSIGSNDLTQLVLGIDRDNEILQGLADERNESVKKLISQVIRICKEKNKYIGICGQAPSDFPEIVEFLVKEGIESISVNSDVVIKTIELVKKNEEVNN